MNGKLGKMCKEAIIATFKV